MSSRKLIVGRRRLQQLAKSQTTSFFQRPDNYQVCGSSNNTSDLYSSESSPTNTPSIYFGPQDELIDHSDSSDSDDIEEGTNILDN